MMEDENQLCITDHDHAITQLITILINTYMYLFHRVLLPNDWNNAEVVEIFKKGTKRTFLKMKNRMDAYPKLVERFYEYDERGY